MRRPTYLRGEYLRQYADASVVSSRFLLQALLYTMNANTFQRTHVKTPYPTFQLTWALQFLRDVARL
jgi:hypothetical protein